MKIGEIDLGDIVDNQNDIKNKLDDIWQKLNE